MLGVTKGGSIPRSQLSDPAPKPTEFDLVIEAGHASARYWRDLWRYRELFYFLAWRDVLVRYKQTVLGIVWAIYNSKSESKEFREAEAEMSLSASPDPTQEMAAH